PHSARLSEADEQFDVLHPRLLLDDVLEEKITGIRVGALRVHRGAPPSELRDVLVVLTGPGAELLAAQLALHPLLGEGIHPAVLGLDGGLQALAEGALGVAHGGFLLLGLRGQREIGLERLPASGKLGLSVLSAVKSGAVSPSLNDMSRSLVRGLEASQCRQTTRRRPAPSRRGTHAPVT